MIVAVAGGVGGAKMAQGLMLTAPANTLKVVVNTADDFDLYGLRICPDIDTVLYTLGGIADPEMGWGVASDTFHTLDQLATFGRDPWFQLGDRDFATHIHRTDRLNTGMSLTDVTQELAAGLNIPATVLPMTDDPIATVIVTPGGELAFQDYFVRRRQTDHVSGVRFAGVDQAVVSPKVLAAIQAAEMIVICPSNPIVSIGPILAVPGLRSALEACAQPIVAVSPIVGGKALKGPADRMLSSLGHESSALGVARLYAGLAKGFVIDHIDEALALTIESETGMRVLATATIMGGPEDRQRLADEVLAFGRGLAPAFIGNDAS